MALLPGKMIVGIGRVLLSLSLLMDLSPYRLAFLKINRKTHRQWRPIFLKHGFLKSVNVPESNFASDASASRSFPHGPVLDLTSNR